MITNKKNRVKGIEPENIQEGYLWCNDLLHHGPNPFPGVKSEFFSPNRLQCKACYNRQQKNRIKQTISVENCNNLVPDIDKLIINKSPTSAYLEHNSNITSPPILQNSFKIIEPTSINDIHNNNSTQQSTGLSARVLILENKIDTMEYNVKNLENFQNTLKILQLEIENIKLKL